MSDPYKIAFDFIDQEQNPACFYNRKTKQIEYTNHLLDDISTNHHLFVELIFKYEPKFKQQMIIQILGKSYEVNAFNYDAIFDIQFGDVKRKRTNHNSIEEAQFEVSGHQWVHIFDGRHGFSLINDGKYGYYVKDDLLDINLLRSTNYPCVNGDIGVSEYMYGFIMHQDNHIISKIDHLAMVENTYFVKTNLNQLKPLFEISSDNISYSTIKKAHDDEAIIIRLYERNGLHQNATLQVLFDYQKVELVNLVEEFIQHMDNLNLSFSPYEVKTLKIYKQ